MFGLREEEFEELKDILALVLKKYPARVYIFGSRAKGNIKRMSDIDLALEYEERVPWKIIEKLKDYFSASDIRFRVDVLDLKAISPSFKAAIEKDLVEIKYKEN